MCTSKKFVMRRAITGWNHAGGGRHMCAPSATAPTPAQPSQTLPVSKLLYLGDYQMQGRAKSALLFFLPFAPCCKQWVLHLSPLKGHFLCLWSCMQGLNVVAKETVQGSGIQEQVKSCNNKVFFYCGDINWVVGVGGITPKKQCNIFHNYSHEMDFNVTDS